MIEAGMKMIEAGLAELRAEHAESDARVAMLKAAAALEQAGLEHDAQDVIARVRKLQELDRINLERARREVTG